MDTPLSEPYDMDSSSASTYCFRIVGHLDPAWSAWFDGLAVNPLAGGDTELRGPVVDQAALHGILQKIRDLNLTLLSVQQL